MAYQIRFENKYHTVVFEAQGELSTQEFLDCIHDVVSDPDFTPGCNHLVDLTTCSRVVACADAMRRRTENDRSMEAQLAGGRCALVATDFFVYAVCRIYKTLMRSGPLEVELFRDMDKARQWLGLPSSATPVTSQKRKRDKAPRTLPTQP